jgi:hypothetical protein
MDSRTDPGKRRRTFAVDTSSTSLVDDEGVDLVFNRSAGGPTLSVQVKSHFYDAPEKIERRGVNALLNRRASRARDDLHLLFFVVYQYEARVQAARQPPARGEVS